MSEPLGGLEPAPLAAATFCATLVDEWVRAGLTDVVVSPGSRNTPLTLAVAADRRVRAHVVLDERSAGFVALGLGAATGRPAVVVTTSGTAAAELHPAVAEAHHARVALLVCTADRPPELQGVGAPQTIDQTRLFGTAVRFFADPGVASAEPSVVAGWRSVASRAWLEATGPRPGPVQLNLPFREPLVGRPDRLPPGRDDGGPWHRRPVAATGLDEATARELRVAWRGRRGVIVAGAGVDDPVALLDVAAALGWPVLADPRSGCRLPHPAVVAHADGILRSSDAAARLQPEVVLRVGEPPASKVVGQWLAAAADAGAESVLVTPDGAVLDPDRQAALVLAVPVSAVAAAVGAAAPHGAGPAVCDRAASTQAGRPAEPVGQVEGWWVEAWRAADDAAADALEAWLAATAEANEPGVARALAARAADHDTIVVSSSMPVRDLEWYAPARRDLRVLANRGANGIDGVVSTAVGVALAGAPTWLLIGDLALLHDGGGLVGLTDRPLRLRIVVVDNAGGGIFSFLPQAAALPASTFERFYGTPQPVDPGDLLALHRIPVRRAARADEVIAGLAALAGSGAPVEALVVRTERSANVAHHAAVHAAMTAAVDGALAACG